MPSKTKNIQKTNRIWDFLVLWPWILIILGIIFFPSLFAFSEVPEVESFLILLPLAVILYLLTIVDVIVIQVYAIHRLYTQAKMEETSKRLWLIFIIIFNIAAIPFLHFIHLRK